MLFLFFYGRVLLVLQLLKIRRKLLKLWIRRAIPYMMRDGQHIERVTVVRLVELAHVVEECVLVGEVVTVLKLGVDFEAVRGIFFLITFLQERKLILLMISLVVILLLLHTLRSRLLTSALFLRIAIIVIIIILLVFTLLLLARLQELIMPLLLPLGPQEVVFGEVLFIKLQVNRLIMQARWQYYVAIFVVVQRLVHGPPPAVLLEELDD